MSRSSTGSVGARGPVVIATLLGVGITAVVTLARALPALGDERFRFAVITLDDLHEGQIELAEAMVLILVGGLLWGRFLRLPTTAHLFLFTALCVLAFDNLVSALFTASFDSLSTSSFATWSTVWLGMIGVGFLVLAAWLPADAIARPRRAVLRALSAAAAAVGGAMGLAWILRDALPDAFDSAPTTPSELTLFGAHPALLACEIGTTILWVVSAILFTRSAARTGDGLTGWLGVVGALSAISSINYALIPSQFTELLFLGDYFFLSAVVVLLVAAVRAIGEAEAARIDGALYAERRRIARQMHDGVTQELVFIGTQTQAASFADDAERADIAIRRIQDSVERALDQSRCAIKELSGPVDEPLSSAIAATADVVGHRTGARLELHMDDTVRVGPDVRSALLSITREAISRAVRADGAEHVRIDLWCNGSVGLRFTDDGTGVMPEDGTEASSMLLSMRERAQTIDGRLTVKALRGAGTTLEVLVP